MYWNITKERRLGRTDYHVRFPNHYLFIAVVFFLCYNQIIPTIPLHLLVTEGWWRKSEVLLAPEEGQALTNKFIIVTVTYHGNSANIQTPAEDNWTCIVGGK